MGYLQRCGLRELVQTLANVIGGERLVNEIERAGRRRNLKFGNEAQDLVVVEGVYEGNEKRAHH